MINPYIRLSLVSILLSSCTLAPNYIRPTIPINKIVHEDKNNVTQDEKIKKKLAWKNYFKSPTLQNLIQQALDNNRNLHIAALNIEVARATYRVEKTNLIPQINIGASLSRQKIPSDIKGSAYIATQYNANLANTAYEIDFFGRIKSLNKVALGKYLATKEAHNIVKISLIAETANAYLKLLADQEILKLINKTLVNQQKIYEITQKTFDLGINSKLALSSSQSSLDTLKVNKVIYERLVEQDKNALYLLIGKDDYVLNKDNLDKIYFIKDLNFNLTSEILLSRPDIKQSEYILKSNNANIGAARAAFFPSISLTGSYGFSSNDLSTLFQGGSTSGAWSFVPQINIPIFNAGRNKANLDIAKANHKIAIANYENTIQSAFREISDELIAYKTLDSQFKLQIELVNSMQNYYNISLQRYKSGIDSHLVILNAEQNLFLALQNKILVQQQKLSNFVNLYKTLGGGED